MRALVVFCHPSKSSFNAAVLGVVKERLEAAKVETRVLNPVSYTHLTLPTIYSV